jgi:hypothetical protein
MANENRMKFEAEFNFNTKTAARKAQQLLYTLNQFKDVEVQGSEEAKRLQRGLSGVAKEATKAFGEQGIGRFSTNVRNIDRWNTKLEKTRTEIAATKTELAQLTSVSNKTEAQRNIDLAAAVGVREHLKKLENDRYELALKIKRAEQDNASINAKAENYIKQYNDAFNRAIDIRAIRIEKIAQNEINFATEAAQLQRSATANAQKTADATENIINAQKRSNEEAAKFQQQQRAAASSAASDATTKNITDTTTAVSQEANEFKALVQEIALLRNSGQDASKQFAELETRLRSFDTTTADFYQLDKYLTNIKETIAYIKKDLNNPSNLADVANSLFSARVPAQRAQAKLNKQAETTGNTAAQQAAQRAEMEKERVLMEKERAAQQAAQEKWDAQQKAQREKELAQMEKDRAAKQAAQEKWEAKQAAQLEKERLQMEKELAARQAAEDKYNAKQQAKQEAHAAAQQKIYDRVNAQQQQAVQAKQAAIMALIAADTQYKTTMQAVLDTTDKVSASMRMEGANAGIAELIRRLTELKAAKKALEDYGLPKEMDARYAMLIQMIAQTEHQIQSYNSELKASTTAADNAGKAGQQSANNIKKGFKELPAILKAVKKGFKSLSSLANKTRSSVGGMAKSMQSNFKRMLSTLTKYVFGFRSLFFLVRRLRRYIGEGIKNMAQFNDGNNHVNESITKLLSSLLYLKNAWATAFSPILQFVTVWLSNLIDSLAEAGNAFSRFLGRLMGVGSVFQAVKVDAADYAKSLDNAAGSAGSAADKTKKLTDRLAAFDDLNVLGVDNDNDGSGGGGGSDIEDYVPDPNEMFTILDVAQDVKDKLIAMWTAGDFTDLGKNIAQSIKDGLLSLNEQWPEIQETAHKIGTSIGTFLNGLLSDPTVFEEAGKAVAGGLNTVGQAIAGFFETYEKGSIGSSIATFFRGIFEDFDWGTAGGNVGELVTTFFTEVSALLKEFPTEDVVTGIQEFFEGIKWDEVVASIFEFIGSAASFIGAVTKGFAHLLDNITSEDIVAAFEDIDWQDVADGIGELLGAAIALTFTSVTLPMKIGKAIITGIANALLEDIQNTGSMGKLQEGIQENDWVKIGTAMIDGLFYGIGEALMNAGQWVADNIIAPIVDAVKEGFDIHSPSGVFEDIGKALIEGLMSGINLLIEDAKQIFTDLQDWLTEKWDGIKSDASEKWGLIKSTVTTKATELKDKVTEKITDLKDKLSETWSDIKSDAYEKFIIMRVAIVECFNVLKDKLKDPVNGIIDIIEDLVNFAIRGINKLIGGVNSGIDLLGPAAATLNMPTFSISTIPEISLPRLAQGAVIPPNKEFMAVLGDQKNGTNIEAPLDTIKQAVAEVAGNEEVIQLLQQLIAVVENKNLSIGDKEIGRANARYTTQQNRIRGVSF